MNKFINLKHYKNGDEKKIFELFRLCFTGSALSPAYWKWRFQDNPAGQGFIHLAWDENVLAAHYAVSCIKMKIEGVDCLTGLSGTTMTAPSYRGRNLFSLLGRSIYDRMKKDCMVMVWGFPNSMIHRSRIQDLSWHDIYEIPMLRLHLTNYRQILQNTLSESVMELHEADSRLDDLWIRIQNDYNVMTRRDYAFINWRYFLNPIERYRFIAYVENEEIKGYAVFKRYQSELQVIDLLIAKSDMVVGEALINYIIAEAVKEKAASVSLWLNVTHPLHHILEKIGFKPEGPVTYLGGLNLSSSFDDSIYDFHRWYFTMSDSDVF